MKHILVDLAYQHHNFKISKIMCAKEKKSVFFENFITYLHTGQMAEGSNISKFSKIKISKDNLALLKLIF